MIRFKLAAILALSLSLSGCAIKRPAAAIKRGWINSQLAYDRWWYKNIYPVCIKQGYTPEECDPNWKAMQP